MMGEVKTRSGGLGELPTLGDFPRHTSRHAGKVLIEPTPLIFFLNLLRT